VSLGTIIAFEADTRAPHGATVSRLRAALESAGRDFQE
jgi:hypothetical protein